MIPNPETGVPAQVQDDIVLATEDLFQMIAQAGGPEFGKAVAAMNGHMRAMRPYEAALIPDRAEELDALKQAWAERDISRLKTLLSEYYRRRQDLAGQISHLINSKN